MRSGIAGKNLFADERGFVSFASHYPRLFAVLLAFIVPAFFPAIVRADFPLADMTAASSVSGQFTVTESPGFSALASLPEIQTNEDLVHLEPALLAVSADRLRDSFLKKIGVDPRMPWGGKIYLSLHPARSLDENVEIFTSRFGDGWNYHVVMPDIIGRERLARALTAVLLLEYANRSATDRAAVVPSWLVDGLSQELLGDSLQDLILSAPDQIVNNLPLERTSVISRGIDPLAGVRRVFQTYSVLTYNQLSWPTGIQLSGDDGGAYRASAQLFVDELLALHNGGAKLRMMLQALPRYYNWQTAFWSGFHENFSSALEVEKWWALQSVIFMSRSPGPQWTAASSREKLNEILSVPVEFRAATNSSPNTVEVSLQTVILNFDAARQAEILEAKLHDLEMAQFRMAPSLAVLTAEYRNVLAAYLGEGRPTRKETLVNKRPVAKASARETLEKLNTLDARRRAIALAARD